MPQERQRRIYARLTSNEYMELQEQADMAALSLSEYIRRRLFGRRIAAKSDLRVLAELRKLGGLLSTFIRKQEGFTAPKRQMQFGLFRPMHGAWKEKFSRPPTEEKGVFQRAGGRGKA